MNKGLLSVLVFSYYSESRLEKNTEIIIDFFKENKVPIEIIIIDDGSKDESYKIAKKLAHTHSVVSAYQLSKNYTTPYAQFAGLEKCKGECAVFCPDDLQRPLNVILQMYRLWEQGNKLILPYRVSRNDGVISDFFSSFYYKVMNSLSDINFPKGGVDGFLADREIIDILVTKIHPINTSTVVEVMRMGFDPILLPYDRPSMNSKSRWTFSKKIKLAKDAFLSSSSFPIKFITYLGIFSFIFSILLIIITIYTKLFSSSSVLGVSMPGWSSTLIIISLFSGLILFSLGIIAEYLWRILDEVKNRPGYIIKKD